MDNSFGAAMAGLVIEDASRMSGARFADARGTGVARRVRTRRRVRAAGMGGASAVAVGALALGASHTPWGVFEAAPGIGVTDCATRSPSDDAYVYDVIVRQGVTPVDTVSLIDGATGATFLTATLQPDGTYVFTDADGNPLRAVAGELPGSYSIIGPHIPPDGGGAAAPGDAEIGVTGVSSADFVGLPTAVASALDDCYTPSPTPSSVPSATPSTDPSRSPDPSLAAKPEDAVAGTNPFECGFEFPSASYGTDGLYIEDPTWSGEGDQKILTVTAAPRIATSLGEVGTTYFGASAPLPEIEAVGQSQTGVVDSRGMTFVRVVGGVVVGLIPDQGTVGASPHLDVHDGEDITVSLLDGQLPFSACPGVDPAPGGDLYAVVGEVAVAPDGTVAGPAYSWAKAVAPE